MGTVIVVVALLASGYFGLLLLLADDHREWPMIGLFATIALAVWAFRMLNRDMIRSAERLYRLTSFAASNELEFVERSKVTLEGTLFESGDYRRCHDVFRSPSRSVEVGTFTYSFPTGSAETASKSFGYIAMPTIRSFPHMILSAAGESALVIHPKVAPAGLVPVEIPGETRFLLYAEPGAEPLARQIFDTELLSRMVTTGRAQVSVELRDGWAYLSSTHRMVTLESDVWQWVFNLIDAFRSSLDDTGRMTREAEGDAHAPPIAVLSPPSSFLRARGREERNLRVGTFLFWGTVLAVLVFAIFPRG